ncbi:cytochrome c biogenesis heme-transporting ATPase CcmA [Phytohalomonas tamaricis]|uniref:cytochrome c biogenesis heme-transporting ATPase CcmA n=1 Tax=Phytohalomonas tamaricis TaxID=2081032 RepID=UPI000D0BACE6|nr:cytochrome c biogenesis heme-transporting ATPase CcmA [Phytohalomonas tamaricis]
MAVLLQAHELSCERDDRWLFENLAFQVGTGDLLRIEGPNGSGKTTLLKILSGQFADFTGTLRWRQQPLARVRGDFMMHLLYLGHQTGIKATLTALENLAWYQALNGRDDEQASGQRWEALATVGLEGFEDVPVHQLSAGQQRRVALARLHLEHRPLWILDEPFTAIDRDGVVKLEQWIVAHCRNGGAVILTTHHALTTDYDVRHVRFNGQGGCDVG